jgi:hypothetical protein
MAKLSRAERKKKNEKNEKDKNQRENKGKKQDQSSASKKSKKAGTANTGPIFYLSNSTVNRNCKKEKEAIEKSCGTEEGKSESKKSSEKPDAGKAKGKLGAAFEKVKDGVVEMENAVKTVGGYLPATKDNSWITDHCQGLWVKPHGSNMSKFNDVLKKQVDELKGKANELVKAAGWKIGEKVADSAVSWGKKTLAKEGAALLTIEIPIVGELAVIGATIWSIVDGVATAVDVAKMAVNEGPKIWSQAQGLLGEANKLLDMVKSKSGKTEIWADIMTGMAYANPCIRARKCSLVPYEETKTGKAKNGKGCCPGQTGHHVLPGAMFGVDESGKATPGFKPCGKAYDHNSAPTICLEGADNRSGSHGMAHSRLDKKIVDYKTLAKKNTIPYEDARDKAVAAVHEVNPQCSEKCLKAQLDAYYKNKMNCGKKSELKANSGIAESPGAEMGSATPATATKGSGAPRKR